MNRLTKIVLIALMIPVVFLCMRDDFEGLLLNNGGVVKYTEKKQAKDNEVESQIYLYENLSKGNNNLTKLIVIGRYKGGVPTYYCVDLLKNNSDGATAPYPIERNKQHRVNIIGVQDSGYSTPEDALNNPHSKIKYTVDVADHTLSDAISNGNYYLDVSNSELVVYGAVGRVVAVIVTTDAPSTISVNSITVNGGLTLNTSALNTPIGSPTLCVA